ncbi:MAG: hypothetical protein LBU05_05010, partial [Bifidobacteriaceae bacterium]|nr:hypothetical protein [Bifidobacteriaceae bacterium]
MKKIAPWLKTLVWIVSLAVVIGLAVTRPGYPVDAADLNDSSVWVTNGSKVARYNAPIEVLTGGLVISPAEGAFDVVQAGWKVAIDQATSLRTLDPAALRLGTTVSYDGLDSPRLALGGEAALVTGSDGAWLRAFDELAGFNAETDQPDFWLGGGQAVITPDGVVFAVAEDGTMIEASLDPASGRAKARQIGRIARPDYQISAVTAVAGKPYALAGSELLWEDGAVDLSQYGAADSLRLQTATAERTRLDYVVVAAPKKLLLIDRNGAITALATGNQGQPAQPVAVGDCVHAAWAVNPGTGNNYLAVCDGQPATARALEAISDQAQIVFRVNRQVVVLNDVQDGRIWLPAKDDQVRDALDWDQIDPQDEDQNQDQRASGSTAAEPLNCDDKSAKPQGQADHYGVRPGVSTILTVLENDSASSCDALAIDRIDGLDQGQAELVAAGRAVQFTAAPGASSARFVYTLSDTSGQTDSAVVTIAVSGESNRAPVGPAQPLQVSVEIGATATYRALAAFRDPDGDPLELRAASTTDTDLGISFEPDGTVTIKGTGGSPRTAVVTLMVADAFGAAASPATLEVDLRAPGWLIPASDPVQAAGQVGQTISLDLAESLRTFHAEEPTFAIVGQSEPLTEARLDAGRLTFKASVANTFRLALTVTGKAGSAQLSARFDVRDIVAPSVIAVRDIAYVRPGRTTLIDPLINDVVEGGAVPVLTDFKAGDGLEAVPISHQYLEISNTGGDGLGEVSYTVSAGSVSASGTILVVQAQPGVNQDPVVRPKTLKVRAGGVVTIPVLEQSFDPDGDDLVIATATPLEPSPSCGAVYASGRSVRYQAPKDGCPTPVAVSVPVVDGAGGSGLGVFTIQVHISKGAAKAAPEPRDLTARVSRGEEVTIPVPLTGIDADGDGVSLLQGLDSGPRFGRVSEIGPDYIIYQAGEDQSPG